MRLLEQPSIVIVMYGLLFGQSVNKCRFHLHRFKAFGRHRVTAVHRCYSDALHEAHYEDPPLRDPRRHPGIQMKNEPQKK
jgi:hypothetical protein